MADITKVTFSFSDGTVSRTITTPDALALSIDLHEGHYLVSSAGATLASFRAELVRSYETDLVTP